MSNKKKKRGREEGSEGGGMVGWLVTREIATYCQFGKHVVDKIVSLSRRRMVFARSSVHIRHRTRRRASRSCSGLLLQQRGDQEWARHDILQLVCKVGGLSLLVGKMVVLDLVKEKGVMERLLLVLTSLREEGAVRRTHVETLKGKGLSKRVDSVVGSG